MPEQWIEAAERFARQELEGEASGHDWWHVYRVARTARAIARRERADVRICVLAALLHDVADEKLNESEAAGLAKVQAWLNNERVPAAESEHVMEIIATMSYKGGGGSPMRTLEGRVVQDADRLDAIGAIGIGRTFAYSGAKGQLMHDPELPPRREMTREQYRTEKSTAINHFHEKLLKLKALMNTESGKRLAEERHRVMEQFLAQFQAEWEGEA